MTPKHQKAVRILGNKGIIGAGEKELVQAFEDLLVKFKDVLSRKGHILLWQQRKMMQNLL